MGCGGCGTDDDKSSKNSAFAPKKIKSKSSLNAEKRVFKFGPAFSEELIFGSNLELLKSDAFIVISKKWENMIYNSENSNKAINTEEELTKYFNKNPLGFYDNLRNGPPPKYRWMAYKIVIHYTEIYQPSKYQELVAQGSKQKLETPKNNSAFKSILADKGRTFSEEFRNSPLKAKFEEKLENVLLAISEYLPEIGYCQGMNFIAGFMLFLSDMNEEETFWVFVGLLQNKLTQDPSRIYGLKGVYEEKFEQLLYLLKAFNKLFKKEMPELSKQFADINLSEMLWIHKWIFCMFLLSFPFKHAIRFWDYISSYGITAILKISMAVLKMLEPKLKGKDFAETYEMLNELKDENSEILLGLGEPEEIIKVAENVEITQDIFENNK